MEGGKLFGFDQDPDTEANAEEMDQERFQWVKANFRYLKKFLKLYGAPQVDGVMADLGISSHQIDQSDRGFSTRLDGPLDMRMDQTGDLTAHTVVNEYSESELVRLLREYGELKKPWAVAQEILRLRAGGSLDTTKQLGDGLLRLAPDHRHSKFLAQIFQAIRIEVNDELGALKDMLSDASQVLRPGGRLVVLTFHSLEDRLVKKLYEGWQFFRRARKKISTATLWFRSSR